MGLLGMLLADPGAFPYLVQKWDLDAKKLPKDPALSFCYDVLNRVSRSFAIVIQQLGPELRDAVCVFYLVLRGLDTVEDDMSIPDNVKLPALLAFHKNIYKKNFSTARRPRVVPFYIAEALPQECGPATKGHYKELMTKFPLVVEAFLKLDKRYQAAIADVTKKMGAGMAEFIEKEVVTLDDYNKYCYYVAGLVGVGLSRLFAAGELESDFFVVDADLGEKGLSNGMGLFLQKTNIIRDYLEDIMEEPAPRMFWPKVVWSKYGKTLADFKEPENSESAVRCLNHLVSNAMVHATESLEYMSRLRDPQVFRFCAIPQVMAIATLSACYDNPQVFKRVVKIPRSMSARIMVTTSSMADVLRYFRLHAQKLDAKVRAADPNAKAMKKALAQLDKAIQVHSAACATPPAISLLSLLLRLLCLLLALAWALQAWGVAGLQLPALVEPSTAQQASASLAVAVAAAAVLRG